MHAAGRIHFGRGMVCELACLSRAVAVCARAPHGSSIHFERYLWTVPCCVTVTVGCHSL